MNIDLIDTRVGTDNDPSFSNGNCLPYTGVPFGMNYFAVQNGEGSWWFNPNKRRFDGFRMTHQPSPWMGDFSHLLFTPYTGAPELRSTYHMQSSYRPEEAHFAPYMTHVHSLRYNLVSEITASTYGMKIQSRSHNNESVNVVLSAPGGVKVIKNNDTQSVQGSIQNFSGSEDKSFTLYFSMSFDNPVTIKYSQFDNGDDVLIIESDSSDLTLSFASSFISSGQADLNLSRDSDSFSAMKSTAKQLWTSYLDRIEVEDRNPEKIKMFYSALYRVFLFPMTFYETDESNQEIHYDTLSKTVKKGKLFTNNGFWDTYKTVYPLFSLIAVAEYEAILEGFLNSFKNSGYLPKWLSPDERGLMPGTLIDAVIADAITKEIGLVHAEELLSAMVHAANTDSNNPNYGRRAVNEYKALNYVPNTFSESVNQSLDNAYSDFCIAQSAKKLGNLSIYNDFIGSASNYKMLFDPKTKFMRAKDQSGKFTEPFSPTEWGHAYTEGAAWQNSWAVYHDFQGLINLFKSPDHFLSHITDLANQKPVFNAGSYGFEIHEMSEVAAIDFGQVAISNQPSFHLPYLYTYAKKPESTQVLIKQLMDKCFKPSFTGYPGDEDNGSMSAWFVFNACGLYPVAPATGEYVRGIPFLDKATLHLSNGKKLTIQTDNNHDQHNFVDSVQVNNKAYSKLFFKHREILEGMQIHFNLGIVPRHRDFDAEDLPYSMSNER